MVKPGDPKRRVFEPYFIGASGKYYFYSDIGVAARRLISSGAGVKEQLRAVNLLEEFNEGERPCPIPEVF